MHEKLRQSVLERNTSRKAVNTAVAGVWRTVSGNGSQDTGLKLRLHPRVKEHEQVVSPHAEHKVDREHVHLCHKVDSKD